MACKSPTANARHRPRPVPFNERPCSNGPRRWAYIRLVPRLYNQNAVFITWTDDNGATWQNPSVQISPNDSSLDDKDWFAIDNNPTSPFYHNIYMLYAPGGASYLAEQHSTDGGLTWSPRQNIPNGSGREYTYPVIAADGTAYDFMMDNWCAGCTGTVEMTKSTNGGVTWSNPTTVTTAQQPNISNSSGGPVPLLRHPQRSG